MNKILILADDLTGANDTGAAISGFGWNTMSVVDADTVPGDLEDYSCISVNLDSRGLKPQKAYEMTARAARTFGGPHIGLYSKRIDSTLRGNLGAECDALLDVLEGRGENTETGKKGWAALVVPAFPQAGRTYEHDTLYVHGVPLEQTAAAKDPKKPVLTSSALELFRRQSVRKSDVIGIDTVRRGAGAVAEAIKACLQEGTCNILVEAVTMEDIDVIAKAAVSCPDSFVAVDPGTFTAAMAAARFGPGPDARRRKVLAVIGSVNQVSKAQTRRLLKRQDTGCVILDEEKLLDSEEACDTYIRQVVENLRQVKQEKDISVLLLSGSLKEEHISLEAFARRDGASMEEVCGRMNRAMAKAAAVLLEESGYEGVFTTGGDITVAVCRALNTGGIQVQEEILPLAVGGRIRLSDGTTIGIATKGGMIGEEEAVCRCVEYLLNQHR